MKLFLTLTLVVVAVIAAVLFFDVQVTDSGSVPKVEVSGGDMPNVDVRGTDVDVKTTDKTVEYPTDVEIKTDEATIEVPTDVDIELPEDREGKDLME